MSFLTKKYSDKELYFIIGSDLVKEVPIWNKENPKIFNFCILKREGIEIEDLSLY